MPFPHELSGTGFKVEWNRCLGPSLVLLAPGPLLRQLSSLILESPPALLTKAIRHLHWAVRPWTSEPVVFPSDAQ